MELLASIEPLIPRKYAEIAEGPTEGGKVILLETVEGEVLERFQA